VTRSVNDLSDTRVRSPAVDVPDSAEVSSLRRAVLASNSGTSVEPWPSTADQHGTQRRRQPSTGARGRDGSYFPERRCRRTTKTIAPNSANASRQTADTPITSATTIASTSDVSRDVIQLGSRDADDVTAARRDAVVDGLVAPVDEFVSGSALDRKSTVALSAKDVVVVIAAVAAVVVTVVVTGSGIMG